MRAGRETLSFAEAIERESDRLAGEEERIRNEPDTTATPSRYSYADVATTSSSSAVGGALSRSRLLSCRASGFRRPAAAVGAVQKFLGLRPHRGETTAFLQGNYDRALSRT